MPFRVSAWALVAGVSLLVVPSTVSSAAAYAASDPAYRDRTAALRELRAINDSQSGWDELRTFIRVEISRSPEFVALLTEFQHAEKSVKESLKGCLRD